MAAPQASSRLELLQARFQQKQLQEKEQKLLQLYDQQQQRAYQVVQRGSAGSNNSNHGSSVSQHTVTRTSTSSHSSTSQGGKVRQMFDERRQTTVKGIDRSYPLEPLENKPRKQTNGNAVQKNGNLTVNRHSVTVKRVARADVNSNLNGGKPVVSYHEEITRESFGPSGQQHPDDDEFGNENHVAQYANGNHRDETHIEEVLNDDTIERNRMMAKLHLMQYDETLKHRVKNDLESEEFPEDFMVDVPDKLPKQSVTKKLSQAEARLERFRNANAKRNNSIAKNTNTIGAPKKRFDPIYPVKSTPSNKGNDGRARNGENRGRKGFAIEYVEETVSSSESEKTRKSDSPKFFCRESGKSATTYAIDSKAVGKSSKDVKRNVVKIGAKRNEDWFSEPNENETERSVIVGIDTVDRDIKSPGPGRISGSSSPDSLKHGTMSCKNVESKNRSKSVSVFERLTRGRSASPRYESGTVNLKCASKSPDPPEKIVRKRSNSPIVLRKHDRQTDRTAAPKSPVFRKSSPRFFSTDADRSATIMLVTPETITKMKTRSPTPASKDGQRSFANRSDLAVKDRITWPSRRSSKENIDESSGFNIRSSVSRFFAEQCEKASRNIDATNSIQLLQTDRSSDMSRSSSPVLLKDMNTVAPGNRNLSFLIIESGKPTTTMKVGEKPGTTASFKPKSSIYKSDVRSKSPRSGSRSKSPEFFCYETEKSGTTVSLKPKSTMNSMDERSKSPRSRPSSSTDIHLKGKSSKSSPDMFSIPKDVEVTGSMSRKNSRESSPRLQKIVDIRSKSPEFFCYETEKSGTTVSLKPRSSIDKTDERSKNSGSRPRSSTSVHSRGRSSKNPDIFSTLKDVEVTKSMNRKNSRGSSPRLQKIVDIRSKSPEYFCYKTEKSDRTVGRKPRSSIDKTDERSKSSRSRPSSSPSVPPKGRSSKSPDMLSIPKDIKVTGSMSRRNSDESSPKLQKIVDIRSKSPEFFCYETEKSGTTVSLKPRSSVDKTERSKSPRSRPSSSTDVHPKSRSSKSPDMFSIPKDIKVTGTMSRRNSRELDSRSRSPEFFCYETEKSGTTISFKPKSTMNSMYERSKSPRSRPSSSPSVHPKDRSSKSPDMLSIPKDVEVTGSMSRRKSGESSPKLQKIADIRSKSPEFFCYETEKSATTVSLKPRSSIDKSGRSKSPRSRPSSSTDVHPESRSSKSPDMFSIPKDIKVTGTMSRRNTSELDARSKSPEFLCYKTEKSATIISFKPKSTKDSMYKRFNSPRPCSTGVQSGKSSKSPDVFSTPKDTIVTSRRGSGNVLRSTKLIRDIIKHQKNKDHGDRTLGKDIKTSRRSSVAFEDTIETSNVHEERHHAMEIETVELEANRNLEYETLAPESSPKNSLSLEVDAEIQEITMPDQYVERGKLQQEQLRTYSRSSNKITQNFAETKAENASTYSVRKPGKKRGSLLESNIFEPSKKHQQTTEHRRVSKSSATVNSKRLEQNTTRNERSSPSPTSESGFRGRKRQEKMSQRRAQALGSIELVRRIMRETHSEQENARNNVGEFIKYDGDSNRNYERTDSVESALRRFDSIGKELGAASAQSTLERRKESVTEKRQTLDESSGIEGSAGGSRTISLKALDRTNVNFPRSPKTETKTETSRTSLKRIPMTIETQEGGQKKLAKARDSIEIAKIVVRSKSPACRRKLFRDEDLGEETGSGSGSSRSTKTAERVSKSGKRDAIDSVKLTSKFVKTAAGDGTSIKKSDERKEEASTGEFTSVKQLRSIEDIRKSIESESPGRKARESRSRSAIANDVSKWSSAGETCRENGVRVGNRKEASLPKRSENLSASNCLRDWDRSFSRVAKSPSPDSSRATETTGNRTRRNVPPSPSKSPDTVSRRPSTDSKAQDTKSTKRPAPMKGTEPIGNRKMTTTTTTRKSTDVVDGPVLENGLHLRDQTAETKYDNDSPTTKKSNAFVIDFDEQPPKENDGSLPRKPRLRKQSMEKQTPSTQSGRPPSSVSSTSSGSTMQSHVSSSKSRMASKVHTPASATTASKRSASTRGGGSMCATDLLVPCKICGRRFAQDRVTLHEQICAKTGQKKRKQFDTVMFRVKGTELEKFVKKGHCKKQPEKPPEVKSNWRRKHEDFINAIRSAKQVQAHLAAGGKLSDLPPPPASDTSDYIQCPHCGRKFNKAAAERHIPKCEHMLHNKPIHSRAPKPKR